MTNREIAQKLGKSEGHVKNLISVSNIVDRNPELETLMKGNTGITLADLLYLRVLPKAALLKVAEEKAKGFINTRAELEKRIGEVKAAAYSDYREKQEKKQKYLMPFIRERPGGGWKLRPMAYLPGKTTSEEMNRIIDTLRELLTRMQSITP